MNMKNEMSLVIPSRSENERFARTVCAAFLLELDPTVDEISEIKTAISEAVTNSIIHAYGDNDGQITINAKTDGESVTYEIIDNGCGIGDIGKAMQPLYTGKPECERSGMGFSIMEAFTDELLVESKIGEGTKITMTKRLSHND
ncbi:MAG: anti-sigma F factor [Clostridia bacterium]|nr:anti-sigma F factor [Clostridia bacterium]